MTCKKNKNNFCTHFKKRNPPATICAKCDFLEEVSAREKCAKNIYNDEWCLFYLPDGLFKWQWVSRAVCGGRCDGQLY